MQYTLAAILAAISAVSAAPAPTYTSTPETPEILKFTMMSLRSASPVHFGQVNASGTKFFIGKETSSYCPSPPVPVGDCPSGNSTSVVFSDGFAGMNVMVPGGQSIYIAPDGSLSYTQAHSASMPAGSKTDGWSLGEKQSNTLRTISSSYGAFLACPAAAGTGPYQIFVGNVTDAGVPSGKAADCLPFSNNAVEFTTETYGAWQY